MTCPKISIITAALNPGPEVVQAIESVLSQSYPSIEYIFIDGGSTAEKLAYIQPYIDKFSYFISEPDKGISDAWNKAIACANGEVIGIINADDYLLPGALTMVANAFESDRSTIIHGNAIRIDGSRKKNRKPTAPFNAMLRFGTPVVHPATFVPKSVYLQIGGFSEAYKIAMDYDFILRAHLHGIQFKHVAKPLVGFRGGGLSDRKPLDGFREVRNSQLENGLNCLLTNLIFFCKYCFRRYIRQNLGLKDF